MDYYLDIKIVPDEEVPIYFIRNKVYSKLHKALVTLSSKSIGISFPEYKVKLGGVLRVHGEMSQLERLQKLNWLGGLIGYCGVSAIQKIPEKVEYRVVSRIQSNMSQSKLKRLVKRNAISPKQIKLYNTKMLSKGLNNPYLELESSSTGHKHRRYIQFGDLSDKPVEGKFDTFGLSKTATVPWF